MSAFIIQGGQQVTKVQPGTPIQLFANDLVKLWDINTGFLVQNADTGETLLDLNVGVNIMYNAWYEWTAPEVEGRYVFYADSSNMSNNYVYFTVSKSAPTPEQNGKTIKINWLLIGGVVGVVGAGFAIWSLLQSNPKKSTNRVKTY